MYHIFDKFINKVYLTEVFSNLITGDAKFDIDFDPKTWRTIKEEEHPATNYDQYAFRISVKRKRIDAVREEMIDNFLRPSRELLALRSRAEETSGYRVDEEFVASAEQFAFDV